jgi:fucose 4-O-acetylase-like acetyltransferase
MGASPIIKTDNQRIAWVDNLKFLGIFAIYLGHFGTAAGFVYPFVFFISCSSVFLYFWIFCIKK